MTALSALIQIALKVVIGVALAAALAALIALLREDGSFASSFSIGCYVIGCLFLLMAATGHSTAGTRLTSSDPLLGRVLRDERSSLAQAPRLSDSVAFGLTALVMVALGIALG